MARATFFSDPYLLFLLGSFFALAAHPKIGAIRQRAFWGGLFASLSVLAAAVFFYLRNPDWMWAYVVAEEMVPGWLPWALFLLYPVPYLAGYFLGHGVGRVGSRRLFLVSLILAIAVHLALLPRWTSWLGTWEFARGKRGGLFGSGVWLELGAWIVGVALLTLAFFLWARRGAAVRQAGREGE